jgi:hypothetical protein
MRNFIRQLFGRPRPARQHTNRAVRPLLETLERRDMPSVVTVDAGAVVRTVNDHVVGVNLTGWDGYLASNHYSTTDTTPDAGTAALLQQAGMHLLRLSNGSGSDEWHFAKELDANGFTSGAGVLARMTGQIGAQGMVTVNFGTGTPQEAAAYLAYLNGAADNATVIGADANGTNWGSAGAWASLRGQAPLAVDDGLNHLRASHPEPFGFKYFEVGNEAYFGAWQGFKMPSPAAYVTFAHQFNELAQVISPDVSVGLGVGNPGEFDASWNVPVLQACAAQGFTPGFLSDHFYAYDGKNQPALSDQDLLLHTVSDPKSTLSIHGNAPANWAGRAQAYRALLQNNLGDAAKSVELMVGEYNSDSDASNKQTTNLVHGLWTADAIGSILETEYNGAAFWDLRNNYADMAANPAFYGWRTGADDGMIGAPSNNVAAPATGPYVEYPAYFAAQLAGKLVHTGDKVVSAPSDTATLSSYAVLQQNGHLALLVINKSSAAADTVTFNLAGFVPSGTATQWTYGQTEDTAQSKSADGAASLTQTAPMIAAAAMAGGSSFALTFPAYSMSVIDLGPSQAGGVNANPPAGGPVNGPPPPVGNPGNGPQPPVGNPGPPVGSPVAAPGTPNVNPTPAVPASGGTTVSTPSASPTLSAPLPGTVQTPAVIPQLAVSGTHHGTGHALHHGHRARHPVHRGNAAALHQGKHVARMDLLPSATDAAALPGRSAT